MEEQSYNITLQAVNSDITISTGNYDDILEYQGVSLDEVKNLLVKLIDIELLEIDLEKDTCPANLTVETSLDSYNFIPSDGKKIYCDNTDSDMNIKDAIAIITNDLEVDDVIKKNIPEDKLNKAVRKQDVAPTLSNVTDEKIDTSVNTPHISHSVWKSKGWQENRITLISFGVIFGIIGGLLIEEDAELASTMFGIMVVLFVLIVPSSKFGHTIFTLGIDWKTNTIWANFNDKLNWVPNANQVTHFSVHKFDEQSYGNAAAAIATDGAVTGAGKTRTWILHAHYSDGHNMSLAEFATQDEGQEILDKAGQLLR